MMKIVVREETDAIFNDAAAAAADDDDDDDGAINVAAAETRGRLRDVDTMVSEQQEGDHPIR
jgi:hypothetical protein